jgi:hypothetical protein
MVAILTFTAATAAAGPYEDALTIVELAFGPIGDVNPAEPGGKDWQVIELAIAAKQLKTAGQDTDALAAITDAVDLLQQTAN